LSWTSPDVRVATNSVPDDQHEVVRFDRTGAGPGRLLFARLDWPGYRAMVGAVDAHVGEGPDGLLEVDLPPGIHSGELTITWQAPGQPIGLALAAGGVLAAILLGLLQKVGDAPAFRSVLARRTRWRGTRNRAGTDFQQVELTKRRADLANSGDTTFRGP
jgi:hypothetical protein